MVFADLPQNTHLKYDLLFSDNGALLKDPDSQTQRQQSLWGVGDYTYLVMAPGFDLKGAGRASAMNSTSGT